MLGPTVIPDFVLSSAPSMEEPRGLGAQPASPLGSSKATDPSLSAFPLSSFFLFLIPLGQGEPVESRLICSLEPNQFGWFLSVALLLAIPSNSYPILEKAV